MDIKSIVWIWKIWIYYPILPYHNLFNIKLSLIKCPQLASLVEFETSPFCRWGAWQSHWNSKFLVTNCRFSLIEGTKWEETSVAWSNYLLSSLYSPYINVIWHYLNSRSFCVPLRIVNCTIIFIYLKLMYYITVSLTTGFVPYFQTVLNDNISNVIMSQQCHHSLKQIKA